MTPLRFKDISRDDLFAIVERAKTEPLSENDHKMLAQAMETLVILTDEIRAANASMFRLKRMLFGASTEKTRNVLKKQQPSGSKQGKEKKAVTAVTAKKRKGHGRNGAAAYWGAKRIKVLHATLSHGGGCPEGCGGKVYTEKEARILLRIEAMAPVQATKYECETLRCNCCGKVYTADPPAGVGAKKYDESVGAMVALLRYGGGMPFTRMEKLQGLLGMPLPAGTQWGLVEEAMEAAEPAFEELIRQAAQGEVLHNDDTTMTILEIDAEAWIEEQEEEKKRTGTFTSGIISRFDGREVALFFTGRSHAGENLAAVLAHRESSLSAPIQMCDALSRNTPGAFKTILGNCMAHARRRFVDVVESFPEECEHVLETLKAVYHADEIAREKNLTTEERLALHQAESGPLMEELREWLRVQIEDRRVEPNSTLGQAITYMRKHWDALTLFLREPGAPLDNNLCERALKKAILHRKNSLFFKTENGARAGDIFMSLIHTAELVEANPLDYLIALQRHAARVKERPSEWMPWNYCETIAVLTPGHDPPS